MRVGEALDQVGETLMLNLLTLGTTTTGSSLPSTDCTVITGTCCSVDGWGGCRTSWGPCGTEQGFLGDGGQQSALVGRCDGKVQPSAAIAPRQRRPEAERDAPLRVKLQLSSQGIHLLLELRKGDGAVVIVNCVPLRVTQGRHLQIGIEAGLRQADASTSRCYV